MPITAKIEVLIAELAAIELWDVMYRSAAKPDLMDQTAFEARQARRQHIHHDIQMLQEKNRDERDRSS